MFRSFVQGNLFSMLNSMEHDPLRLWRKVVKNGHVKCIEDEEIQSFAIEVDGKNTRTTYITLPLDPEESLGIGLPFLNLLVKKTGEEWGFEITVMDDKKIRRQICVSTWQTAKNKNNVCVVNLKIPTSWDYIHINLAEVTAALFGTKYVETVGIKIHANCRIRNVYFSDRLYSDLPSDQKVEENTPNLKSVMSNMIAMLPDGWGQQAHRGGLNMPKIGIALQTTATGEEYSRGFHTILNSIGWSPLKFWKQEVKNGHVVRVMDEEIKSSAIEVHGRNTRTTYITCPPDPEENLGIRKPFLNMLVKKTGEDLGFEITVIDDKNIQRRITLTTFRKDMKAMVYVACVPLILSASWKHININLEEHTYNSFSTKYVETVKIQIHANCRIRRVYFTDRLYSYQDLPKAFKVNISGQSQIVHSKNTGMADKSSPLPAGSGGPQGQGIELSKQPTGSDLQTSTAGHDCMRGIQSILNSTEKDPLKLWKKHVENGHVECVMDKKINSSAIDLHGGIMETTYITCPPDSRDKLSIKQPILNLMMKKTGEEFGCKITVTDDKIIRRQIILTTFTRKMKAKIYSGFVPIRLSSSFEHVNINLAKVTHVLFGTRYVETVKIKIHANCRIRSVYFSDRLYTHKELPDDYKVEENSTAPRVNTVVADVSMVPEGSRVQGYTKGRSKQRIGSALQTTAAGHDYVHGFHTILYSMEGSPLKFWKQEVKHGNVECITDEELKTLAIEVQGKDIQTTSISCPSDPEDSLGIRLPFFNLLIKKTGEDWCFEITVTDDKNVRWQIIQTTFRKDTKAMAHVACVPLRLSTSWERISIDLAKVTHALFGTKYMETSKIKIYANCRIRRVFFTDRLYSDQELPGDFKVNIIERKTAPSTNTKMAEKSSLVPAESRLESHGKGASKQRTGLQTTTEKSNQGFHTILNSVEKAPLKLWKEEVENGDVKCIKDEIITSSAIEVQGSDMQSTSITCPPDPEESLGIRLPCLNLLVKKTGEDWGFELTLIDDRNVHHRIYLGSHSREGTPVPLSFRWPLKLSNYWQYFCLDLADVTNRVFKTNYVETAKIKIYANCRIRRVYFTDRLYSYHELPSDYKVKISIQG